MKEFIKQISDDLIYASYAIIDVWYHIRVKAKDKYKICPRFGEKSTTVHTKYIRKIKDLPIGDKKVICKRNLVAN